MKNYISYITVLCIIGLGSYSFGQNAIKIIATLDAQTHTINIQQEITFYNQSNDTINAIYLNDWNNAYANKKTALAKRFAEEFNRSLHLAKEEERGNTKIISISDKNLQFLDWKRLSEGDLLKVQLKSPIYPGKNHVLKLFYTTTLPDNKFTYYGHTNTNDYNLRYWYITPAVHKDDEWMLYSNTDLDDLYTYASDYEIVFNYPLAYKLSTDLDIEQKNEISGYHQVVMKGNDRADIQLFIESDNSFDVFNTKQLSLITNIESKNLSDVQKVSSAERVIQFVDQSLGTYPHKSLLVSEITYRKNPLYGLNQLPSFLRPYPEDFQYEMKILKTTLYNWLRNTIFIDSRKQQWIVDAIQNYLMIKYVDEFYPNMTLLGNLSNTFIIKNLHLAKMPFNEQYPFLHMLIARKNLDQPLTETNDSLIKFNQKIANKYKAGLGLIYLENYLENNHVSNQIKAFYRDYRSKDVLFPVYEAYLKLNSPKNIDWFFDEYISTRNTIDFKIKKVKKVNDSVLVTIKNKSNTNVPITLYGIDKKDSIVSKYWLSNIKEERTFKISRDSAERLVLNYDKTIPEFNQRDNWKSLNGFFSSNKKIQLKFFKDAENPYYSQLFYVPVFSYNVYDEFMPGLRFHNKAFLEKPFIFDMSPSFSIGEKTIVGSGLLLYRKYIRNNDLYLINYSLSGSTFHFAEDSRFTTITPAISFGFRTNDLRSNARRFLTFRYVSINRNRSNNIETDPDYNVFNARYNYSNNGIINYFSWFADMQFASDFSKISFDIEYRRLFQNNRQLNLRFFFGKFINNDTNSDFFSYALDRPTDYLFDFNYLGRSEDSGIFSQQIIIAEGGFKSKIRDPFANDWIATTNASFNVWRWVELYGDIGFIKSKGFDSRFVYDSGVRLNLVTDYFELYFPLYSNNGWEIGNERYDQKIRFIITLSPKALTGLFTRKWF
ncbi:metalloprotease [Leptobacterium sp. I13]|uniref:metalloprotease n=1 Tax=Leptobacterium meishanense TaxID=3128904 RepID=UPI0030EC1D12